MELQKSTAVQSITVYRSLPAIKRRIHQTIYKKSQFIFHQGPPNFVFAEFRWKIAEIRPIRRNSRNFAFFAGKSKIFLNTQNFAKNIKNFWVAAIKIHFFLLFCQKKLFITLGALCKTKIYFASAFLIVFKLFKRRRGINFGFAKSA